MATTKKQTAKKECIAVARIAIKTNKKLNGHVCTLVRSSKVVKGETVITEHKIWTHANGCAASCDCEGFEKSHGRRKCHHITFVEAREAARQQPAIVTQPEEASAQPATETAAATGPSLLLDNPEQREYFEQFNARAEECRKQREEWEKRQAEESKRRVDAPLNGNRGFSLLRTA